MYDVVSLFAGIGGIDLGFIQSGFNVCWANELNHAACNTFRHNFGSQYLVEVTFMILTKASFLIVTCLLLAFPVRASR